MLSPLQQQALARPPTITVTSSAFAPGSPIPRVHSGHGDDSSPPLAWAGVPAEAKALAIVMDDPDAPMGTWTHWTAWDLKPTTTRLPADAKIVPLDGAEGLTSAKTTGHHGPAPPSGTHRYFFRVFALDAPLGLPAGASIDDVWRALGKHTLAWGELMGTFTKP